MNSADILCVMGSNLPSDLRKNRNREVSKIRRHNRKESDLEDFIMYIEKETMLMSDPLFSRESLLEPNTVKEWPGRTNKVKDS